MLYGKYHFTCRLETDAILARIQRKHLSRRIRATPLIIVGLEITRKIKAIPSYLS